MITCLNSVYFCEMCGDQKTFKFSGGINAGRNNQLELENWECPCNKFCLLFAKSQEEKTFLISKVYAHARTSIMTTFDCLANEIYEVKLSMQGSSTVFCYDPRYADFNIDPINPDENLIIEKIEMSETFS